MCESVGMFVLGCVFFTKRESEKHQFVKSSVLVYLGHYHKMSQGFPGDSVVKNPHTNAGDAKDSGSIHGSGRSPG